MEGWWNKYLGRVIMYCIPWGGENGLHLSGWASCEEGWTDYVSSWPGKNNLLPGLAGADGASVDPVLRLHLEPNLFDDAHQQAIHVVVQSRAHLRT